jgi:hypothetical protein
MNTVVALPATGMDGQHAIEFFILDREAKIAGYTWLIEWATTSFYISSRSTSRCR